jgi:purine-binding chemotaxis protein CheW
MTELRNHDAAVAASLVGKYLTFRLADEEYGLEIMKVQEIIGLMPITQLPRVPEYVRGIINLRGHVTPTIDLRTKFGLPRIPDTEKTCIIVVEVAASRGKAKIGIVVDEVAEVLDFRAEEIELAPEFGTSLNVDFMLGLGVIKGAVKILLDVEKVLTFEEVRMVQDLSHAAAAAQ